MKLVLINYEYPPVGGGAGNATAHLAESFATEGHDVVVVTSCFGNLRGWIAHGRLRIWRLPALRRRQDRSNLVEMLSYVASAIVHVTPWCRRERPDGLIAFFSLPCGPVARILNCFFKVPYIVSLRGGDVPGTEAGLSRLQAALAPIRRDVLRHARAVVANSAGLAQRSAQCDPIPVEVIPNGVDANYFKPPSERVDSGVPFTFLFAGRLQPQKNLPLLLRQYQRVRRTLGSEVRLVIVGDGPDRTALLALAEELEVDSGLTWRGWLDRDSLRSEYGGAHVFLNPSLYEGMPNTVLEAMAMELAVIASRVMGNDELVVHRVTGCLFDLDSPDQLGDFMIELAGQRALVRDLGRRGRERVQEHYSWSAAARRYSRVFDHKMTAD